MLSTCAVVASLLSAASAHQNLHQFWVNDVSPGYEVAIRRPPSNNPVTDVTSEDIVCNVGGNIVPSNVVTAPANEGDSIKVQWDSSTHPGPITHMLFGPVDDASQATGVGSWFKIDEFASTENGTWANVIMAAQDMTYTFNLPTGLASGEYLLRSEMLALHGAADLGGAQFYIGCAQLKITGTGSAGSCGPSIELPGAYKADDPNIYIPDVYFGLDVATYKAPGGPVAKCGGSGTSPSGTGDADPNPRPAGRKTAPAGSEKTPDPDKPTPEVGKLTGLDETPANPDLVTSPENENKPTVPKPDTTFKTSTRNCATGNCVKVNDYYSQCIM
ncbi:uncharacterized protein L3040_006044 [Drepanopeziza brunnea f. sp. 'multigermtubi']|uniref:uncharacterized protein n=1 Tax=Drepanopeziza brunnea f. sp. 'multigermtubi' TaxID=698441 RepID=UPI002393646A|nr:hypothetical protein L3040_006044 [Drepanopeziza brunnea f. sp. 'multigermtubi']